MKIDVSHLDIYTEQLSFLHMHGLMPPERLYFLRPYGVEISLSSKKLTSSKKETYMRSVTRVKSDESFELQVGLKEVATYLLLGQVVFQFLNDITLMQSEIDIFAKRKITMARKDHERRKAEAEGVLEKKE